MQEHEYSISNTAEIAVAFQAHVPFRWRGLPGVGKSAALMQIGEQLDYHVEVVVAATYDPTELGGLPIVGKDSVRRQPGLWLTNVKRALEKGKNALVFCDEFGNAPHATQSAALLGFQLGRWGDEYLPKDRVAYGIADNPIEASAGGWGLAAPTANRFVHYNAHCNQAAWIDGMISNWKYVPIPVITKDWGKHLPQAVSIITSFINAHRTSLHQMPDEDALRDWAWPSPRSWGDMGAKLLAAATSIKADDLFKTSLLAGAVGEAKALEFVRWQREQDLPDPEVLLARPEKFVPPKELDRLFAIMSSVYAAIQGNLTPARWKAGWKICAIIAEKKIDLASNFGDKLCNNRPKGEESPKEELLKLYPFLKKAGFMVT